MWASYAPLLCELMIVFSGRYNCQEFLNKGKQSRHFPPGYYADGALCDVGQTIIIRDSYYLSLSTDNNTDGSNGTAHDLIECRQFISEVHEKLISACENRIACDDMMVPVYHMTCGGNRLYADYLHVTYECLTTERTKHDLYSLACKDNCQQMIDCKDNGIIVKDLLLGYRGRGKTCTLKIEKDDCLVHYNSLRLGGEGFTAQHQFIDRCDGHSSCSITSAEFHTWNITCGTEPRNSSNDYFLAIYECLIVPHRRTICNENAIDISCSEENLINITSAWFVFVSGNETCPTDDKYSSKRCSMKHWTDHYYNILLLHCHNKSSCDEGLLAEPAPSPGLCYNGQFSTEENRTTDAVTIEYTCIPGTYLQTNNNSRQRRLGYMHLLVGIVLGVTAATVGVALVTFARLKVFRRDPDPAPENDTSIQISGHAYDQTVECEKTVESIPDHIYAVPMYVAAGQSSTQYSGNVYSEITTQTADPEGNISRNTSCDTRGRPSQRNVYARVNRTRDHYDELELYDNKYYGSSEELSAANTSGIS